ADPLTKSVEDFWHFGKIARYDAAASKAGEVSQSGAEPIKILEAFEKVAAARGDNLDEWMIRWQGVEQLREPVGALVKTLNEGRFTRRGDPEYISRNITRLSGGERPFSLAMVQLKESGELAVPMLLAAINDPAKPELAGPARRAIREIGRPALNPLVAATENDNANQLTTVIELLGDLGYDAAIPYLVRITESQASDVVKQAANGALQRLGFSGGTAGDLFYDLSEKLYYGRASLVADLRFPTANVWRFESGKGLARTPVPPPIFNDVMAMRAAEYALSLNTQKDALSLWLAANYKREADLPQGATDPTRAPEQPPAHYYGVTAGPQYLNASLTRALRDRHSPVALAAVKSLQEIVGDANYAVNGASPLIAAMQYPDRRVRFEAAFTLAQALPQTKFDGQEAVVPLLAEAVAQTGQPSVLVVMPTQEAVNAIVDPLKGDGFITAGAMNPAAAVSAAAAVPAIDVVIISDELPPAEIETLLGNLAQSPKTRGAGKLFIVKSNASEWEARKASDSAISTTTATDAAGLKPAITSAREAAGALPLDPETALQYALRGGELLKRLAISRGQVLDLAPARGTLLGALEEARPEVVKIAGESLALMNDADAQRGIAIKATAEGVPDDVKVSLFNSVATGAKFFGNKLDQAQVDAIDRVLREAENAEVKAAAAEARGALNLPSDQARTLILDQSKR
ncbi:MAG TPA: HEAT repeat domain-containing protein, partial [Tepidisphaeraceae bacterium]